MIEDDIDFCKFDVLREQIEVGDPVVIQCPFLMRDIHRLDEKAGVDYDTTCVVMMHRYRKDIEASEARALRVNFPGIGRQQKRLYGEVSDRHVSDVKYQAWEIQRPMIKNTLDVGYLSLRDHPLWVEDRSEFRFQHNIKTPPLPTGFIDGLQLIQNL